MKITNGIVNRKIEDYQLPRYILKGYSVVEDEKEPKKKKTKKETELEEEAEVEKE